MTAPADKPMLEPRTDPIDLAAWDVPHPSPRLFDVRIGPDELSNIIAHVSNIEYVRWLDRAAELHADSLGYTRPRLLEQGIMWFVARHEIDYLAEAFHDDELVIATWVRNFRKVKSWRDYCIVRPADGTLVCRAATLWVLVDLATRRPTRIAPEVARCFEPLEDLQGSPLTDERPCTSR
jgi:acyl-CoA thioester hydrolase